MDGVVALSGRDQDPAPKLPASSEETACFAFPQNRDFRYTFARQFHGRVGSGNHSKALVGIGKETCWIENSS